MKSGGKAALGSHMPSRGMMIEVGTEVKGKLTWKAQLSTSDSFQPPVIGAKGVLHRESSALWAPTAGLAGLFPLPSYFLGSGSAFSRSSH